MKNWLYANQFLVMLVASVVLAFLVPEPGAAGGWLEPGLTIPLGVASLFFVQGLLIPTENLKRGLLSFRTHGLLQLWIFIGMPLLVWSLLWVWPQPFPDSLWLGFMFMAFLPSTVSTAVVFTTVSGGDTGLALFNTTLSNLVGIFLVPLACALMVVSGEMELSWWSMVLNIGKLILLPLVLGQCVHVFFPKVRAWVFSRKQQVAILCNCIIIYIVYCSFADSVQKAFWREQDSALVLGVFFLCLTVLLLSKVLLWTATGGFRCAREIRIALLFSGSQKTLAAGIPLGQSIFGSSSLDMGLILMPILFYHILQLFIGGVLVNRFSNRI